MPFPQLPVGLEAKANKILADLQNDLVPIQAIYLAQRGRYWQGILTHPVLPRDGAASPPDKRRKPTDQIEDWNDVNVPLPANMECAVAVDVYNRGPAYQGYVVRGEVEIAGERWVKQVNVGPPGEGYRTQEWTRQTEI